MKKRALISVFDKTGILEFAQFLNQKGVEIISTGGTYKFLKENGLSVIDVSEVTNFKEMLDGRVKTLHPNIHGGILAIRDNKEHMDTIAKEGIETIDYVVVNLYPFFREVQTDKTFDEKSVCFHFKNHRRSARNSGIVYCFRAFASFNKSSCRGNLRSENHSYVYLYQWDAYGFGGSHQNGSYGLEPADSF